MLEATQALPPNSPGNVMNRNARFHGSFRWMGLAVLVATVTVRPRAEDWPEWRGNGRLGLWNETGIVQKFPEGGPPLKWRATVGQGYAGPAVADGRVFVTDARHVKANQVIERARARREHRRDSVDAGVGDRLFRPATCLRYRSARVRSSMP
jgi:hypothetical protein